MTYQKLTAIDLFAGAGGLSLGFGQTGLVDTKVAVEINRYAQRTYKLNHEGVRVVGDIKKVNYKKIAEEFGAIDIVIGGPPCQGFSNANRQKNELISGNNQLVREFVRSVQQLRPRAFVMENVKAMQSKVHKFFVSRNDEEDLKDIDVNIATESFSIGQLVDGIGELLEFIQDGGDISPFILADDLFSKLNSVRRSFKGTNSTENYLKKNSSYFQKLLSKWDELHHKYSSSEYQNIWLETRHQMLNWYEQSVPPIDRFQRNIQVIVETQKILRKIREAIAFAIDFAISSKNESVMIRVKTYRVLDYVLKKLGSFGYSVTHGVLNAAGFGVPQVRERLFIIGVREDALKLDMVTLPKPFLNKGQYYTIGDAIGDLENIEPSIHVETFVSHEKRGRAPNSLISYLNNSLILRNHIITASTEIAKSRFAKIKPWENFHSLDDNLKTTYSDASRTQNTIYLRLDYSKVSRSVCNVRKSMWIHPVHDRAISIREAARLQSFPDIYAFEGTKDAQYQQIGNAVPPLLAQAVAETIIKLLGYSVPNTLQKLFQIEDNSPVGSESSFYQEVLFK